MNVFITGATGYIGFAVAFAFAAKGHRVIGLVRSPEKAKKLKAAEIQPVMGTMNDPKSYTAAARLCQVYIHCAAEMSDQFHTLDRQTVDHLIKIATESGLPRTLIYTSGVWLYGNTVGRLVDESSPLNPVRLVIPRQETENRVLHANSGQLATISIRPGCVYGGTGGLTATWFDSATQTGQAQIVGEGNYRWAMIHVQDLAELYVRAAESYLSGHIFNATDRSRFTILECAQAASQAAGADGRVQKVPTNEMVKKMGDFAECLTLDQHVDSSKAMSLLNWQPRHGGFVDGVERYFNAWKASQP